MTALAILLAQNSEPAGLTTGGIVVMIFSCGLVLGLLIFCLSKILSEEHPEAHHHAPLDIDTRDTD